MDTQARPHNIKDRRLVLADCSSIVQQNPQQRRISSSLDAFQVPMYCLFVGVTRRNAQSRAENAVLRSHC